MNILAVIPARGGSKGIPYKNICDLNGKPLIAYAVDEALGCAADLYKVIVSTDDPKIAEIAIQYGAAVPFMRPHELATDEATSLSVVQHAVYEIEKQQGVRIDWALLIQPTNPLVLSQDIQAVVNLAKQNPDATSVVSICAVQDHPLKIKTIHDGLLKPYIVGAPETIRRQDFPETVYKRNGSLYMTRRDILLDGSDLYGDRIIPYEMPLERSIDIDTAFDLDLVRFMLAQRERAMT